MRRSKWLVNRQIVNLSNHLFVVGIRGDRNQVLGFSEVIATKFLDSQVISRWNISPDGKPQTQSAAVAVYGRVPAWRSFRRCRCARCSSSVSKPVTISSSSSVSEPVTIPISVSQLPASDQRRGVLEGAASAGGAVQRNRRRHLLAAYQGLAQQQCDGALQLARKLQPDRALQLARRVVQSAGCGGCCVVEIEWACGHRSCGSAACAQPAR